MAIPMVSKKTRVAITRTRIWSIVLRISVRFFLVFASWCLNPFSITTLRRNFITLPSSNIRAKANKIAKKICISLLKGRNKEPKKRGILKQEYREIFEKSSKKLLLKVCCLAILDKKYFIPLLRRTRKKKHTIIPPQIPRNKKRFTSIPGIKKEKSIIVSKLR